MCGSSDAGGDCDLEVAHDGMFAEGGIVDATGRRRLLSSTVEQLLHLLIAELTAHEMGEHAA